MPQVLLTGSSGQVGRAARPALERAGWSVCPFDLTEGQDLRHPDAVFQAAQGCDAVVHAGAIAHDSAGTPADIIATNVLGTWHVLLAAERAPTSRVVYLSSAQVFGFAEGEGAPLRLPVDDGHPVRASRPYGMSKRLAEEMCAAWTARTSIPTIVLRPVLILDDHGMQSLSPESVEYGAFVHVNDVAAAIVLALTANLQGHHRLTLCGAGPFDTTAARTLLSWSATRAWPTSK